MTTRSTAFVTAVNPYPTDSGKAIVLAGILEHLRSRMPAEQIHFLHVGRPIEDLTPFRGIDVREMGSPTRAEQLTSIALNAGLRRRSLQETFTASPSVARRVSAALDEISADLEIIDTVRMTQHVTKPAAGRRVVYLDDLFSVRYERMLDVLNSDADMTTFDPLGQFGQFIPRPLHRLTSASTTRRMLLSLESKRVARSEIRVAQDPSIDCGMLLNDAETRLLRERSGGNIRTIPVRIDPPSDSVHQWDGSPEFIFMGLLSIAHNHDGLMSFLRKGMPRLLELTPEARLHVVGRDPSPELLEAAGSFGDRVVMHGFVPDLDEVMLTKCALINPLRFGSGVKIKTLDALGRGLPVVATSFGAEGISEVSQPGLVLVKDAEEGAAELARLTDPAVRAAAAKGALELFQRTFALPVVDAIYDEVFGTRPGSPSAHA